MVRLGNSADMKIRLCIERDLQQIEPVGACLKQLCDIDECPELSRVELLASELLSNVIKHSIPHDNRRDEFPVGLTVVTEGQTLTLSVSDIGKPMSGDIVRRYTDTEVVMPRCDGEFTSLPECGWGVQLIKSICSDISYERLNDSNVLHLCFNLKTAG